MNTGNLSQLLGSRPPARAFAQIPYKRIPWFLNSIVAGRGASRRLLHRDLTTATYIPAQEHNSHYRPWNGPRGLPPHLLHAAGPMSIAPTSKPSQPAKKPATQPVKEPASQPVKELADDEPAAVRASPVEPAEQERRPELDRIQSKVALWDSEARQADARPQAVAEVPMFTPSDQIHVMGLDLAGRYIAHTLAGCQTIPPVRYLIHSPRLYKQWGQAGSKLTVYRGNTSVATRRVVGQYISEDPSESQSDGVIDNLIVTLPAAQVVQALGHIRHRLDHRSTICLVNDGLGVAEKLVQAYFPDESRRPIFLLGHFTTSLGYTRHRFSVTEVRAGRLYLSLWSPPEVAGQAFTIKRHPPLERTTRAMHLVRLLTAMPGLHATGHPMVDFLRYKLPTVAFRTIVDPLAVLLDCRYDELSANPYARQLIDKLIGELSRLVSRLPECKQSQKFRQVAVGSSLRHEVLHKLMLQRTADSKMRAQVGRGWDTDVEFLAGYFARRGREVGANVPTLDSLMWAVKAKQVEVLKELEADVPFEPVQLA